MRWRSKRRHAVRDPASQMQALAERTMGWDPQALEAEIAETLAIFEAGCLAADRCFETKVRAAFAAASISVQNLLLARAFRHRDPAALDTAARRYVAFDYLHYRMLRCFFKKDRQADLYGLFIDNFGFAACAAIFLGADKEARWLAREYARHVDAGYQCPHTLDEHFVRTCRWIIGMYLDTSPGNALPTGLYEHLAKIAARPEEATALLAATYDRRIDKAYRCIILEDESEVNYCDNIFPAVFPFEMLAFQRLVEAGSGTSISFTHPAVAHLDGALAYGGSWQDDFVGRAERRLAEIESELGIAPL